VSVHRRRKQFKGEDFFSTQKSLKKKKKRQKGFVSYIPIVGWGDFPLDTLLYLMKTLIM
jgi:hypothetical protein